MRSFAEVLEAALREPAPAVASGVSTEARVNADVQAMLAAACCELPALPGWARTMGVRVTCTKEELRRTFKRRAFETHPDRPGGSHEAFLAVSQANEEALAAIEATARTAREGMRAREGSRPSYAGR